MTVVTNHELRKKLAEVQLESRIGIRGITTGSGQIQGGDVNPDVSFTEKRINRVQGEDMIAVDGTRGKLFMPMPGLKWKCRGVASQDGLIWLEKELTGLFVTSGNTSYCIGVWGDTNEFEVLLQVGSNEIRVNDLFVNLNTSMLVKNGLEERI